MRQLIKSKCDAYFDDVVAIRRQLHQHPELSFCEQETAELIKKCLASKNIDFQAEIAGTGIVATITGNSKLQTSNSKLAIRADMDALPIHETTDLPYRSVNDGVMHACGHDAHVAMLLGTAFILNDLRDKFSGTIKLIFQPGEEKLPGGASLMIKEGVLDDVDMIIGQHVYPDLPCGEVGFHAGPYMASSDEVNITVKGRGGHAAKPAERDNAVLAAAKIVSKLSEMYPEPCRDVSRNVSDSGCKETFQETSLLAFGGFHADGTYNVIPSEVNLKGTMRTFDEAKRKALKDTILNVSKEIASEYGCEAEVFIESGYPSLKNDVKLTDKCTAFAKEILGESKVKELPQLMTAEDFAWYSQKVPACFYRLGTSNPEKGIDSKQHTSNFNIDENAMKIGMELMTFFIINML